MSEEIVRTVTVDAPNGLHLRPADMIVKLLSQYKADVRIEKDGELVDGTSILSILTLDASHGTKLVLRGKGEDAAPALDALVELFRRGFEQLGESPGNGDEAPSAAKYADHQDN